MRAVFSYEFLRLNRTGAVLVWALLFPLILTFIFMTMFANIGKTVTIGPQPLGVVDDAAWQAEPGLGQVMSIFADKDGEYHFANLMSYDTVDEVDAAARSGTTIGYVVAEDGVPVLHLTSEGNSKTAAIALRRALDVYTQTAAEHKALVLSGASPQQLAVAKDKETFTERLQVTPPGADSSARYYFALLALSAGMGMSIPLRAVNGLMAPSGALGARRTMAAVPRWKTTVATLAAAWVGAFLYTTPVFLVMRFIAGTHFGSHWYLGFVVIAASSFMAAGAGALMGTFPKMSGTAVAIITTPLSLLTGLYGPPTMRIADAVETHAPVLAWINPLWQATHAFYGLLYYDTLRPFATSCLVLVGMGALFLALALVRMRRMSHDHL
ncbi:ABC transporter permease [Schaalia sp. 19OD2882]|uniref:ABC transporter permease n=1 Tax=Schaalia sp. 19OD2882 TaxID=2794089 RepID=UPI001C1EC398|nr:ABC transporter permease [Schaalia sp. 19OD2882]QWW20040.1 ABC transporter permease [Schaalia sp. 19OD2882]